MVAQWVIDKVDRLKPNAYSAEDKLDWISDVDTYIRSEIIKYYNYITINTTAGEVTYDLPEGVVFENIEYILYNNKRVDKVDFRSYGINGYQSNITINSTTPETILLVYLIPLSRYRYIKYISKEGNITFGTNYIQTLSDDFTFEIGDTVEITGCTVNEDNNKSAEIIDGTTSMLLFADNTFTEGNETGIITITRVLNDVLIAQPPYDKMYHEYLFAMIDFNNREYESYNNNMIMYNNTLKDFANWYKQRSPVNLASKIYNIW